MKVIRCSSLPILAHCLGLLGEDYISVNPESKAADAGTAVHAAIAHWIKTGEEPDDGSEIYSTFLLFKRALTETEYAPRFELKTGVVEHRIEAAFYIPEQAEPIILSGHPDLFGIVNQPESTYSVVDLIDYKSGWNFEKDYIDAMRGYAWLLTKHFYFDEVHATIIRRDFTAQSWKWTREELDKWMDNLALKIAEWDGQFIPGDHCEYCPRRFDCTGLQAKDRAAIQTFAPADTTYDLTDPATCLNLWEMSRAAKKVIEAVEGAIRNQVIAAGGRITDGEREMILVPSMNRVIDPERAWAIIEEELPETMPSVVKIPITALETALKAVAGRGQKQMNVTRVLKRLAVAGGLKLEPGASRLTIRKVKADG